MRNTYRQRLGVSHYIFTEPSKYVKVIRSVLARIDTSTTWSK